MSFTFGPDIDVSQCAYVDETVRLFGKLRAGEGSSFWPYVVARSEMQEIVIGEYTNIQDHVMIHVGLATPTIVGAHCSVTHHTTIHGCKIGDNCLIGINATLMDGVVVGDNCIVAGHSILSEGTVIPPNSIVAGVPAKVIKSRNTYVENKLNAWLYHYNALAYAKGEHRAWSSPDALAQMAKLRAQYAAEVA